QQHLQRDVPDDAALPAHPGLGPGRRRPAGDAAAPIRRAVALAERRSVDPVGASADDVRRDVADRRIALEPGRGAGDGDAAKTPTGKTAGTAAVAGKLAR